MRLSDSEIKAIKDTTKKIFGKTAVVKLFGSRVDDHKRGGDIDLLISDFKVSGSSEQYMLKIKFLVELKKLIEDQKIDVVFDIIENFEFINSIKNDAVTL